MQVWKIEAYNCTKFLVKKKLAQNAVHFYATRKCFTLSECTPFWANFFFTEKFVQLYASIFHTCKSRDWFQLFIYLIFSPEISDWFQFFIYIKKFFNFLYTCKCRDNLSSLFMWHWHTRAPCMPISTDAYSNAYTNYIHIYMYIAIYANRCPYVCRYTYNITYIK